MTFTIPPDSSKARQASAFGRELQKACSARDISLKELERTLGVGHTTLHNYRFGRSLPKVATATSLAQVLDWPKLRALVVAARTRTCKRKGCEVTFVNDIGSEAKKYCSPICARISVNLAQAERRARSAGQTGSHQARRAHVQRLRAAVRIADDRAQVLVDAIAEMCRACEPEGLCRTAGCPLRAVSPLPLETRPVKAPLRTLTAIRDEIAHRPDVLAARSVAMKARHADPEYAARHSASLRAAAARRTPEQKATSIAKAKVSYPAERRSVVSTRMHAERRQKVAS